VGGVLIADILRSDDYTPNAVEINRIRASAESADSFDNFGTDFDYDFTIVNENGDVLFSTRDTTPILLGQRLHYAIINFDAVVSFSGNTHSGYIIVYIGHLREGNRTLRLWLIVVLSVFLIIAVLGYYFYMRYFLYSPFKKLKEFASDIAAGNLDTALPMDKDNLFGDFTESFDIMRDELKTARQKVIDEEKSKKELIAALSHDIKTPVAIVRAASELLEIGENDKKKLANIKAIQEKSLEIDNLVTDLFSSALEDLSELKINICDITSKQVQDIILSADSLKKADITSAIPDCLIKGDVLRLAQVFGNIISNSYKYANSTIKASFEIADKFLAVSIKDAGKTLNKEEVSLLTQKFYRGKNADGKHGAGLGLYICSKLMNKMDGDLSVMQESDGLKVVVRLLLS